MQVCNSRSKAVTHNRTAFEMLLSKFTKRVLDMHAEDIKLKHLVPCLLGKTAKPNILCEHSSQIDGLVAL